MTDDPYISSVVSCLKCILIPLLTELSTPHSDHFFNGRFASNLYVSDRRYCSLGLVHS
jgi:hypothetical protein